MSIPKGKESHSLSCPLPALHRNSQSPDLVLTSSPRTGWHMWTCLPLDSQREACLPFPLFSCLRDARIDLSLKRSKTRKKHFSWDTWSASQRHEATGEETQNQNCMEAEGGIAEMPRPKLQDHKYKATDLWIQSKCWQSLLKEPKTGYF